jgi:SNF2 family DNA or RNA helicase
MILTDHAIIDFFDKDKTLLRVIAPSVWKDILSEIPAMYWDTKQLCWRIHASWPGYLSVYNTFKGHIGIEISEDVKEWLTKEYSDRIYKGFTLRSKTEPDFPVNTKLTNKLRPFQIVDAEFLTTMHRALLTNGMGSGKTVAALSALEEADAYPALVVTLSSTKFAWENEVAKFYPHRTVQVINGTASQRKKQFKSFVDEKKDILVINWENLRNHSKLSTFGSHALKKCQEHGGYDPRITPAKCEVHPKELNFIDFKGVVADEAHRIKDPASKTASALRAATGDAEYRFALTGTPVANGQDDLYSILLWLYPETFPSKTKWIDRYLIKRVNYFGGFDVIGIKPEMEEEWYQILNPILRRMPKELVLPQLPPIVYMRKEVEMSPKQKSAYNDMRNTLVADLESGKLIASTALVQMTRLQQLASSYAEVENTVVIDEETGEEKLKQKIKLVSPSNKIDAFIEDLPDYGDSQIVVFSPSKQIINLLEERLIALNNKEEKSKKIKKNIITYGRITGDEGAIERQYNIDLFQEGKLKLMLVTTQAGGTGITLTNADVVVYLGRSFNKITDEQSLSRVHRIGSEKFDRILCVDYISPGTVDYAIMESLNKKEDVLQDILRDKDLLINMLTTNTIGDVDESNA